MAAVEAETSPASMLSMSRSRVASLVSGASAGTSTGPERLIEHIPGAAGQAHAGIDGTSFYIIEDAGTELARRTIEFVRATAD